MASTAKKKHQTGMSTTKKDDLIGWLFTAPELICAFADLGDDWAQLYEV